MLPRELLAQIKEGMDVYDNDGDKVGTVRTVFVGEADDEAERDAEEQVGAPEPEVYGEDTFLEDTFEMIEGADEMPEELRERLLRHGYVRIDTGLFSGDRYAMAEQIAGVSDEGVTLTVDGDNLPH